MACIVAWIHGVSYSSITRTEYISTNRANQEASRLFQLLLAKGGVRQVVKCGVANYVRAELGGVPA